MWLGATEAFRGLVAQIRLVLEEGKLEIELADDIAAILALVPNDKRLTGSAAEITLVAEARKQLCRAIDQ